MCMCVRPKKRLYCITVIDDAGFGIYKGTNRPPIGLIMPEYSEKETGFAFDDTVLTICVEICHGITSMIISDLPKYLGNAFGLLLGTIGDAEIKGKLMRIALILVTATETKGNNNNNNNNNNNKSIIKLYDINDKNDKKLCENRDKKLIKLRNKENITYNIVLSLEKMQNDYTHRHI